MLFPRRGRNNAIIFLLIMGTILLIGCGKEENRIMYKQISQNEAKQIMDQEQNMIILDVRTPEEYAEGHIPNAICIPNETIDEEVSETLTDKQQTILVYCRSGNRSKQAAQKLVKMGYEDVRDFGGITSWQYEVVK